jgi:hypothetical protein
MANQVGVVDTGYVQVRVSYHHERERKIGLSVVKPNDTMFHFMLFPPETHGFAARLLDIASRLSNSLALQVPMIKGPALQVRASILDHHRRSVSSGARTRWRGWRVSLHADSTGGKQARRFVPYRSGKRRPHVAGSRTGGKARSGMTSRPFLLSLVADLRAD